MPSILFEGDSPSPLDEDVSAMLGYYDSKWWDNGRTASILRPVLQNEDEGLRLKVQGPEYLYAYWHLGPDRLTAYNRQARDGHLTLKVFKGGSAEWMAHICVHPESRHWFIPVEADGELYTVELGFRCQEWGWIRVAHAGPVQAPRARPAEPGSDQWVRNPMFQGRSATHSDNGLPSLSPPSIPADFPHPFPPPPLPAHFPKAGVPDSSRWMRVQDGC